MRNVCTLNGILFKIEWQAFSAWMCQIYPLMVQFLKNLRNDLKSAHENLEQIALLFIMTRLNLNSDLFFRSA